MCITSLLMGLFGQVGFRISGNFDDIFLGGSSIPNLGLKEVIGKLKSFLVGVSLLRKMMGDSLLRHKAQWENQPWKINPNLFRR